MTAEKLLTLLPRMQVPAAAVLPSSSKTVGRRAAGFTTVYLNGVLMSCISLVVGAYVSLQGKV